MPHPSERLSELINTLNLNVNSFATECGYSSSTTIWRIINDKKKPSRPTLDKICERFKNVNKEWLLTGQGTMFITETISSEDLTLTAKQVIEHLSKIIPDLSLVEKFAKELNELKKETAEIHEKITSIEFLEALKVIKGKKKKTNEN